jgi:hypothetical protein
MIEADRVLSTPRTDSSLQEPMFPPALTSESRKPAGGMSRRHMLAGLAVLPAVGAVSSAAVAKPVAWPQVSDAFRDGHAALAAAKAAMEAARADVARLEAPGEAWVKANPEPTDRRARKKWNRKYNVVSMPPALHDAWHRHYEAEMAFEAAQVAFAQIPATSRSELLLKAVVGTLFDGIALNIGRTAIISFSVSRDLVLSADTRGLL